MAIVFAGALSHAPGIMAWTDAAPAAQKERIFSGFESLHRELEAARPEELVLFTSEHWANFFLNHISPFCIGRADEYVGPVEPWLKIDKVKIKGNPERATEILKECYRNDLEPGYAYEMEFDHGTMIPLHFLMPAMNLPVVPIMINTLADPQPSVKRCMALGRVVGERGAPVAEPYRHHRNRGTVARPRRTQSRLYRSGFRPRVPRRHEARRSGPSRGLYDRGIRGRGSRDHRVAELGRAGGGDTGRKRGGDRI